VTGQGEGDEREPSNHLALGELFAGKRVSTVATRLAWFLTEFDGQNLLKHLACRG
jgi:hypothetical protein